MTTIHILHGGFPLCGFSSDYPYDWPSDHKWISKIAMTRKRGENDPEEEWMRMVEKYLCPTCAARVEE